MLGKISFIILFSLNFQLIYSQDIMLVYNKLLLEKDSLEKILKPLNEENIGLKEEIKELKDDLKKGIDAYNKLKKEYIEFVENSKKDILKNENNELVKKVELLTREKNEINKQIAEQKKIIEAEQKKINLYGKEERERGKEEIYKWIVAKYEKPFDTLIKLLTFEIIELDTSFLTGYNYNKQKCIDVLNYFEAERVLSEKFNEQGVAKALVTLLNIKQESKEIEGLKNKLDLYKTKNEALKRIIDEIKTIDAKYTAYPDTEDLKKSEIFGPIFSYLYNYKYNLTDYPHVTKVILKIINMKERDANQSISKLLDEL